MELTHFTMVLVGASMGASYLQDCPNKYPIKNESNLH